MKLLRLLPIFLLSIMMFMAPPFLYSQKDYTGTIKDFEKAYFLDKHNEKNKKMYYKALLKAGDRQYEKIDLKNAADNYLKALSLYNSKILKDKLRSISDINRFRNKKTKKNSLFLQKNISILVVMSCVLLVVIMALVIWEKVLKKKSPKSSSAMLANMPPLDELQHFDEECYSDVVRANRLLALNRELKKSSLNGEIVQEYILELNHELKSSILDLVEKKLDNAVPEDTSSNAFLEILMPLITDENSAIQDRTIGIVNSFLPSHNSGNSQETNLLRSLGVMADSKTGRKNHSLNVAELSYKIACELDHPEIDPEMARKAGLIHDVGLLEIDSSIMLENRESTYDSSRGRLTNISQEQYEIIKTHSLRGLRLMNFTRIPPIIKNGIQYHHERLDGSGYPNGLKGEEIPLIARLIAVADFFESLTSQRPNRKAVPKRTCLEMLISSSGTHFDRDIVQALKRLIPVNITHQETVQETVQNRIGAAI
ncbi:MAG: HD domain-containing protein [bacterium]|nr:HD domain-containing protein [bacterium]